MASVTLIDGLRNDELDSLRSEIMQGRRDHILKALDERGRAQELVRQQYTGRYPFELLQNANDAAGDRGATGHAVRFVLSDTAVIVADQGGGFGDDQIRAICGLGRSSKDPRKSIGYKGLGFKSVGEITDRPQVISGDARFMFDEVRVRAAVQEIAGELGPTQRLPVYAFPFRLDEGDLGSDAPIIVDFIAHGFRTVLRLPLKAGRTRNEVEAHLVSTLTPELLLFLDATDELELTGASGDFRAVVARDKHADHLEALLETGSATEHWLVFQRQLKIPSRDLTEPLGDAWKEVDEIRVAAAVPLGEDGRPQHGSPKPLHVYFPTEERSGFSLLLQGDFVLDLDRRHVARAPEAAPYNAWVAECLADLVADQLAPGLAQRFPGDAATVSALGPAGAPTGFGEDLWSRCVSALRRSPFVPVVDGQPRRPPETLLLPPSIASPTNGHRFLDLNGLGRLAVAGVEARNEARTLLRSYLDAEELDDIDAVARLRAPAVGFETDFYEFIVAWSDAAGTRHLGPLLRDVPFVRILGGRWAAPADRVFFPRQRGDVAFPPEITVPIADVPEVEGLHAVLLESGVSDFEWRQLLPEFVLPLLTSDSEEPETREAAFAALRAYYEAERSGDPRIKTQIARVLVSAHDVTRQRTALRPAGETYFSSAWMGNDLLEHIYGEFGKPEFLALHPSDDTDVRAADTAFLKWVGVSAWPRVDEQRTDQRGVYMVNALPRHPHRRYEESWTGWRSDPTVETATICDQGHPESQQLRASFALDRFPELIESGDADRLRTLWQSLATRWGAVYEPALSAQFYCQNTGHAGERSREAPSLLAYMLLHLEWVPAVQRGERLFAPPDRVWRAALDTPRRILQRVPVMDPSLGTASGVAMATALGIVDAARPAPIDLAALLEELALEHEERNDDEDSDLYEAARWVMRTLNDVLDENEGSNVSNVLLLARRGGHHVFDTAPFVADDPLLSDTWESTLPILDADRDLRRLHRVLNLRRLDDEVERRPRPLRPRPDLHAEIEAKINQAKPYLATVASEAVRSRRDDVYRGLARLEVQVCEELVLEYELDGEVRRRNEAVAYIAVRNEQDGIVRRRIGTAHLEIDPNTGEPHWYAFGPELAQFLSVPTQGDAFSILLAAGNPDRRRFLAQRHIPIDAVDEARVLLQQPPEDEVLAGLFDTILGSDTGGDNSTGVPEHATQEATADDSPEASESENPPDEPDRELPELDISSISIVDAPPEAGLVLSRPERHAGPSIGPTGPVDHERQGRLQRVVGRRGEKAAYHGERSRLKEIGLDPDVVHWVSQEHPFAPYDIESLDADGQRIYIEVKATGSDDPTDSFEISAAELLCAIQKRTNYYVYRVTSTLTAHPDVARYQDPISRIREGEALLTLSGARLAFGSHPPSASAQ